MSPTNEPIITTKAEVNAPDMVYFPGNNTWSCCESATDDDGSFTCKRASGPNYSINQSNPLSTLARAAVTPGAQPLIIATSYTEGPYNSYYNSYSTSLSTSYSSEDRSSGLSDGEKAGIGVGVAAFVIIVLTMLGFFARRWRKKRNNIRYGPAPVHDDQSKSGDIHSEDPQEIHGKEINPHAPREMQGMEVKPELDSGIPQEIGGRESR